VQSPVPLNFMIKYLFLFFFLKVIVKAKSIHREILLYCILEKKDKQPSVIKNCVHKMLSAGFSTTQSLPSKGFFFPKP